MKKILSIFMSVAVLCFSFGPYAHAKMVQVKGSDTLINLVQKLSEVYMEKNPDKVISVTGGGSGTGIAALVNGKCSIANASRLIKTKEVDMAVSRGVDPKKVIVAVDGLCFLVNSSNVITQLTVDQLGKIFRGEITNWKEVGGDDKPISLYGRQSNSGTYDFVMEFLTKGDFSPKMRQMNGNAQIIEGVKADPTAIGYVGIAYVKGVEGIHVLEVSRAVGGKYFSPMNDADIKNGNYPLARPLYQYVDGMPAADVKDFIAFELSPEGQNIVKEEGFFEIPEEYIKNNKATVGI
ncbi:MAG TPA: phosphate ABC transporter substrate-binding protein [Candidatus Omnitrophota bacterium]|nr:phosphate ABC transporter substrate-binding protein [Candidatus Omnitrophota bacterium]HPS20885.1 phosphate ABC transporter substrate-binding protein [Candidatus Omnitrophota bacterium]